MKKWTNILLLSSLVFSTLSVTPITSDADAKGNTKVETAATAKKEVIHGLTKTTSKKDVEKIAKKKSWKKTSKYSDMIQPELESLDYALEYSNVSIYNKKKVNISFSFINTKKGLQKIEYRFKEEKVKNLTKKSLKQEHNKMVAQIQKDIGSKPTFNIDLGINNQPAIRSDFKFKNIELSVTTRKLKKDTLQHSIVAFYN